MRSPRTDLRDEPRWQAILSGWAQPSRQRDVGEFLLYVLQHASLPILAGRWQSYTDAGPLDEASLATAPIFLNIGRTRTLQAMIYQWQQDETCHRYLVSRASTVILQIIRFLNQKDRIRKLTTKLEFRSTLSFKSWIEDREGIMEYDICGGVYHIGKTVDAGHYRSVFIDRLPDGTRQVWVTDDGVTPQKASSTDEAVIQSNLYLLSCKLTA